MKKKTILLVYYKLFKAGGVAKVMTNLANELVKEGYNVEILLLSGEQTPFYELDKNIKIHYADMFKHWTWDICEFNVKYLKFIPKIHNINSYISHIGVFLLLKNWLGKNHHRYNTIVSCWYKLSKIISFLPKKIREKTFAWEHISHTVGGVFYNKILGKRYKYLKGVIAINTPSKDFYKKMNKNSMVIYNMMDQYFENNEFVSASEKENLITMVARLDPEKNISEFLDIIKEANIPNDWKVQIIGNGYQKEILLQKVQAENIKNVEFLGSKTSDEVYKILDKSKINCLTSTAEGLPTVLIEAMFCSNVLVAYDCNYGPSDIINDRNGFLIPFRDKQFFKEKLEFLTNNTEEYYELNKNSYIESQKWKKENILQQWKEIL